MERDEGSESVVRWRRCVYEYDWERVQTACKDQCSL